MLDGVGDAVPAARSTVTGPPRDAAGRSPLSRAYDDPRGLLTVGPALERELAERGRTEGAAEVARALALAALTTRDVSAAASHLARVHGHVSDPQAAVVLEAHVTGAAVLASAGRFDESTALLGRVIGSADAVVASRARVQLATVAYRQGDAARSRALLDDVEDQLRARGDLDWLVSALVTRSHLAGDDGEHDLCAAYLTEALTTAERAGHRARQALILHSLGWVTARRGDLPASLLILERAASLRLELGLPTAFVDLERGVVMRLAGLRDDALERISAAVAELRTSGTALSLGEALLELVVALGDAGRADEALRAAADAASLLRGQERPRLAAIAEFRGLEAVARRGGVTPDLAARIAATADQFEPADRLARAEATLLAAECALEVGLVAEAERQLVAAAVPDEAPPGLLARQHLLRARLAVADGRPRDAERHARSGIDRVGTYRRRIAGAELHAHAAAHTRALRELLLTLALERGDVHAVRDVALLSRIESRLPTAVRGQFDGQMDTLLVQLRLASAAELDGVPDASRRRRALEGRVRELSGAATTNRVGRAREVGRPPVLTFVEQGGGLLALVSCDGEVHAVWLDLDAVRVAVGAARFASMRLARELGSGRGGAVRAQRARANLREAIARLDELVFLPLGELPPRVTVSPSTSLEDAPWGALAGGRCTVVLAADDGRVAAHPEHPRLVALAGPRLDAAVREVEEVARTRRGGRAILGASAAQALEALSSADYVHLACHGRFRLDNPMFSTLEFHDGSIFVHDIVRLERVPSLVVLSACDSGRAAVVGGAACLGTAAALIAAGVDYVIAATVVVPDELASRVSAAFHGELARVHDPVEALRRAQSHADRDLQPFVCFTRT